MIGTPQPDVIIGSDEGEALAGGRGRDQITGGRGADAFVFETPGEFGKRRADYIFDFNRDERDKVAVVSGAFEGIKRIRFKSVYGKRRVKNASEGDANLIYNEKNGKLYYDANGSERGLGNDGGAFAQLLGSPEFQVTDLVLL